MASKPNAVLNMAWKDTPEGYTFTDIDLRAEALACASRVVAASHEANVDKRAAQTIYVAEIFMDWLAHGIHPQTEGNLRRLYFIGHPSGNHNGGRHG